MALKDNELLALEPLILPDPRRLDRIPCLPQWVVSLNSLIRNEEQRSTKDGKYRTVPTLPAEAIPSAEQRAILETYVSNVELQCAQTPEANVDFRKTTFAILTDFMLLSPSLKQQGEAAVEALGKAYMFVVEDLPWWATLRAVELWQLGEAGVDVRGHAYAYHWPPAPAELRRIAKVQRSAVSSLAAVPRKLLAAEPRIEYSEEHCAQMSKRLAALSLSLK